MNEEEERYKLIERIRKRSPEVLGPYEHGNGTIEEIMRVEGRSDLAVFRYRIHRDRIWWPVPGWDGIETHDQIFLTKQKEDGTWDTERVAGLWTRPSSLNVDHVTYNPEKAEVDLMITRDRHRQVPEPSIVPQEELYNTFRARYKITREGLVDVENEDREPVPPL